jgi:hypothetical protein
MPFPIRETPPLDVHASSYCHTPRHAFSLSKSRCTGRWLRAAAIAVCGGLVPALLVGTGQAAANPLLPLVESFKTPELAAELIAELRLRAPPDLADRARVVPTYLPDRGGFWYRVVIGGPTSRFRVRSICAGVLNAGFRSCVPVPPATAGMLYVERFFAFLGSFETRRSAELMAEDVRARANHLFIAQWVTVRLIDVPDRGWRYRVVVGPRSTEPDAQGVCDSLWRLGFDTCFPVLEDS